VARKKETVLASSSKTSRCSQFEDGKSQTDSAENSKKEKEGRN